MQATSADIAKGGGIQAIAGHIADLEKSLSDGAGSPPPDPEGRLILLTDGPTETLAALAEAATKKQNAVAHPNPYPVAALYLALYYNEVHRYDDALRVIDAGLKQSGTATAIMALGAHLPQIYSERSTAYAGLKRFGEALAVCDAGLTLAAAADRDRARFNRCRGFDLTELGRLDEAEAAYNESLKLDPDNALAKRELAYIARLRAGGKTTAPGQVLVPVPPAKDGVTPPAKSL